MDDAASGVTLDHWEERRGDHVTGRYALLEPGGYVRTVNYEVTDTSGYRATVHIRKSGALGKHRRQIIISEKPLTN